MSQPLMFRPDDQFLIIDSGRLIPATEGRFITSH